MISTLPKLSFHRTSFFPGRRISFSQVAERLKAGQIVDEWEMLEDVYVGETDHLRPERPDHVRNARNVAQCADCCASVGIVGR